MTNSNAVTTEFLMGFLFTIAINLKLGMLADGRGRCPFYLAQRGSELVGAKPTVKIDSICSSSSADDPVVLYEMIDCV